MTTQKKKWTFGFVLLASLPLLAWVFGFDDFVSIQLAWRALETRDYDRASYWAKRAILRDSGNPETEFLLARIARKQLRIDECLRHLKRAEALGFDRLRIRREMILVDAQIGQIAKTQNDLPQLLLEQQGDGAEICEAFANGMLMNGMENEARILIRQWAADFPNDPVPDVLCGRLEEFHIHPVAAEAHYRAALKKFPKYPLAVFGLARSLREQNRWQEALELYQLGLSNPVPAPAQLGIARCLRHLGRDEEADAFFQSATETPSNEFQAALRQLGEPTENDSLATEYGMMLADRGETSKAIRWLQRAIDYNPKDREARYQLAKALQSLGKGNEAKTHFEYLTDLEEKLLEIDRRHDALRQYPDDLESRFRLGVLLLEVRSEDAGLFWLRSVLARDPHHQLALDALREHFSESN